VEQTARASAWRIFWKSVVRFQAEKVNPWLGLRNMLGVAIPLTVGAATGSMSAGLIVCTGALNVSFRDSDAPYRQRAREMFLGSVVAGIAVSMGSLTGHNHVEAVIIAGLWAFAAGMLVAISQSAADLGAMSVVMMAVYAAVPLEPRSAALAGLAAFSGGLLQTLLALAFWPVRRYVPERKALGDLYFALSKAVLAPLEATLSPPATAQFNLAQTTLVTLDRSMEAERFRALLSQAERMRLSLIALGRLRLRMEREGAGEHQLLDRGFEITSRVLAAIGDSLRAARPVKDCSGEIAELEGLSEKLREKSSSGSIIAAMARDARVQMDALAGQLRSAVDLDPARENFETVESKRPWRLRLRGNLATLRANLSLESAACRHAIRLGVCIAIGDSLGRGAGLARHYWIPMTIAIVLKPDFSATFSRGLLRLGGTFAGLVIATGLFHVLPHSTFAQIATVAAMMFITRWLGPANYGIAATAITAIVVFLVSLNGVSASAVMGARAWNTAAGGAIALAAYWLWPTWERHQVSEAMARMLDQFRRYFQGLRESLAAGKPIEDRLERPRVAARLARTNLEASIERACSEPGVSHESLVVLTGILASSHRLAYAFLSLEAAVDGAPGGGSKPQEPYARFCRDVDLTLYYLAAALRGSPVDAASLPDLREDHHALIHAGGAANSNALVNVETDRITNSLNTLGIQVFLWIGEVNPLRAKSA
jgi:uncharacterized membrane protein YccC